MAAPQNPDLPPAGSFSSPAAPLFQTAAPTPAELLHSLNQLRRMFRLTTAALVLFLLAMNIFLLNQLRLVRRQASDWSLQVKEMQRAMDEYNTNGLPYMLRISADLHRYADTHPDFATVMARYPKPTNTPPAVTRPPVSPAPAPPRAATPAPAPKTAPTKR